MFAPVPDRDTKGLREFGIASGALIAGLFGLLLPWLFSFSIPVWPFVLGGGLVVWALLAPDSLNPVYRTWMRIGMAIGAVMSRIVLFGVFVLVVLPIGLVMRLFGHDPMARRFDKQAVSYRVAKSHDHDRHMDRPY